MTEKITKKRNSVKSKSKLSSMSIVNIELESLNVKKIQDESKGRLTYQNTIDLIDLEEDNTRIKTRLSARLFDKSFEISLEILGTYKSQSPLKEDEIKKELDRIAAPLLINATLIIGFVTDKMHGIPIVLPPLMQDKDS